MALQLKRPTLTSSDKILKLHLHHHCAMCFLQILILSTWTSTPTSALHCKNIDVILRGIILSPTKWPSLYTRPLSTRPSSFSWIYIHITLKLMYLYVPERCRKVKCLPWWKYLLFQNYVIQPVCCYTALSFSECLHDKSLSLYIQQQNNGSNGNILNKN
jgi:hypothetical protein